MISSVWDDSILFAGLVRCPVCRRVAYPSDAGWLDETLIMATFPAPCVHWPARVVVINPGQLPGALDDPSRYLPGRRRAGRTRSGRPCRAYAEVRSDFCNLHGPADTAGTPA